MCLSGEALVAMANDALQPLVHCSSENRDGIARQRLIDLVCKSLHSLCVHVIMPRKLTQTTWCVCSSAMP